MLTGLKKIAAKDEEVGENLFRSKPTDRQWCRIAAIASPSRKAGLPWLHTHPVFQYCLHLVEDVVVLYMDVDRPIRKIASASSICSAAYIIESLFCIAARAIFGEALAGTKLCSSLSSKRIDCWRHTPRCRSFRVG